MNRLTLAALPLLVAFSLPAVAEQTSPREGCIDVQVDQYRALAYDCLTRQLQGGDAQSAKALRERLDPVQQLQRRSPSQLGLATPAATSNRMGSNFGRSAVPQRP